MALIVEQHVVADMYPVGSTAISAGMLVELDTDGTVIPGSAGDLSIIGIAGDSALTEAGQTTAYSSQVVIGAVDADTARSRWTSNRIVDMYDETLASGKITIYNGGGKFWISDDLVVGEGALAVGATLIGAAGGLWGAGATAGQVVAIATAAAQKYPSGVPGTEIDGSIALGTPDAGNNWTAITLRI